MIKIRTSPEKDIFDHGIPDRSDNQVEPQDLSELLVPAQIYVKQDCRKDHLFPEHREKRCRRSPERPHPLLQKFHKPDFPAEIKGYTIHSEYLQKYAIL
jgi:hypothetical protein